MLQWCCFRQCWWMAMLKRVGHRNWYFHRAMAFNQLYLIRQWQEKLEWTRFTFNNNSGGFLNTMATLQMLVERFNDMDKSSRKTFYEPKWRQFLSTATNYTWDSGTFQSGYRCLTWYPTRVDNVRLVMTRLQSNCQSIQNLFSLMDVSYSERAQLHFSWYLCGAAIGSSEFQGSI